MTNLFCSKCHRTFSSNEPHWRCDCGGLLDLNFTPQFDLDTIQSRPNGMWRYREALPIEKDENIVSFSEGFTPLIDMDIDDF